MEITNPRANPYVGPRSFQTGERLFGRDRELRQLLDLLVAERIVLLHSPSGAGKTSLIRAGLIPALEAQGFTVLPPIRVNQALPEPSPADANRYAQSAILSLKINDGGQPIPAGAAAGLTLQEFLNTRTRPPSEEKAAAQYGYRETQEQDEVLIFDQFEEILTIHPTDRDGKEEFFAQLGETLRDRNRWALFAIREDYLAALAPYTRWVPTRLHTTYRLDLLGILAARQAIQGPPREAGVIFQDEAAARLVDDLRRVVVQNPDGSVEASRGPYVEPVQLQVVCYRLWQHLHPDDSQIDMADLEQVGDVDASLGEYYADQAARAASETGVGERAIREWFQSELITAQGLRGQVILEQETSGGLPNPAIRKLVDAHLVRGEQRGGVTWFELAHDRLIAPVQANNRSWLAVNLNLLQKQAALWERQGRPESMLLRGRELAEARQWAAALTEPLLEIEREYLAASNRLYQRERRVRLLTALIAVLGLVAIVLAFFALRANQEAQRQARRARTGELAALAEAEIAAAPPRSLLLAVEALKLNAQAGGSPQPAAEQALRRALEEPHGVVLAGHSGTINALAVSPDGARLATAGEDGTLRVWDLLAEDPANEPLILGAGDGALLAAVFSPDGRWLAAGSETGLVTIYDLAESRPNAAPVALGGHTGSVRALAFSPDGRWLASGSLDLTARLWPLAANDPAAGVRVLDHPGLVWALAFSPDRRWLATGAGDGIARLWELGAPDLTSAPILLPGHSRQIQTLAFSPDGRWLATGSLDQTAQVWDMDRVTRTATGDPFVLSGHTDWVTSLAFSPDRHWLATGSGDKTARLWVMSLVEEGMLDEPASVLPGHLDAITGLAFSPDGQRLATASQDGKARLWDLLAGSPAASPVVLNGHEDWVTGLVYTPDGQRLVTASRDGAARIWDQAAPDPAANPQVLGGHMSRVSSLAFSPDERWLATGGGDPVLRNWNLEQMDPEQRFGQAQQPQELSGHTAFIGALAYSPDGRWLASGSGDGTVRVWEANRFGATGDVLELVHGDRVNAVTFSPDGAWLAAGTENGLNWLWYLEAPDPEAGQIPLPDHEGAVLAVAFSADGRWLATGSADNTARLWDMQTAEAGGPVDMTANLPSLLVGHTDDVLTLAFSPENRWLATGGGDGQVHLWDVLADDPAAAPRILEGHSGAVNEVAFSPDGRWLASAGADGVVRLWSIAERETVEASRLLLGHEGGVQRVAFSPDGRLLASGGADGTTRLWEPGNGSEPGEPTGAVLMPGQGGAVLALAFSPDGQWLAAGGAGSTAGDDGTARLWLVPADILEALALFRCAWTISCSIIPRTASPERRCPAVRPGAPGNLPEWIEAMFSGEKINTPKTGPSCTLPCATAPTADLCGRAGCDAGGQRGCWRRCALQRGGALGAWKGYTGKPSPISSISASAARTWGPRWCARRSSRMPEPPGLRVHFVSNVDSTDLVETLKAWTPRPPCSWWPPRPSPPRRR
jgi:WD40 repeat protein